MESFVACLSMQKVEERWQDGYTRRYPCFSEWSEWTKARVQGNKYLVMS